MPEHDDPLALASQEVDRLFGQHSLSEYIQRDRVHVGVARWNSKNGVCKYNRQLTDKHRFGKRVTGLVRNRGRHTIIIDEQIVDDNGRESFFDTVRHELAHVIAYVDNGKSSPGHGRLWKEWARRLGADPSACHNKKQQDYDYYIACPDGCFENGKHRRSKTVKKPWRYYCPECETRCVSYDAGDSIPETEGVCAVSSIPWRERGDREPGNYSLS